MGNPMETEYINMDDIWNKMGAIIGAAITALSGLYMNERRIFNNRIATIEKESSKHTSDIRLIENKHEDLKSDLNEIKASQQTILELLLSKSKR